MHSGEPIWGQSSVLTHRVTPNAFASENFVTRLRSEIRRGQVDAISIGVICQLTEVFGAIGSGAVGEENDEAVFADVHPKMIFDPDLDGYDPGTSKAESGKLIA